MRGGPSPLAGPEGLAARRADHGPAQLQDPADGVPVHFADAFATVHHTLVALIDCIDFCPLVQCGAHHRPDRCVHALGVAAAGKYCYSFICSHIVLPGSF